MLHDTVNITKYAQECPKCGSKEITSIVEGQPICTNCGFVISQTIEEVHDKAYRKRGKRGEYESKIEGNTGNRFSDMERPECLIKMLRITDAVEKNLGLILCQITKTIISLSIPKEVLETALRIYEDLAKKCTFKGKPLKSLSAAIVYVASKKAGYSYSLREISYATKAPLKKIFQCYEFIIENINSNFPASIPEQHVSRVCRSLDINGLTAELTEKIVKVARENRLCLGKSPTGIIAAALYISSILTGKNKTQREIAEVTRVTEATIRARYKEIIKKLIFILSI